jgi:hypothetical protein
MATKLISFLGALRMTETTYLFEGKQVTSCYMTEAAARFFQPQHTLVMVTSEAREMHFAELTRRMADLPGLRPIDIPSGRTEAELWDIFNTIAAVIDDGDTLYFDVTNAFRSLPILTILVASFVRTVRKASLARIIYGAFDPKAPADQPTPVFDLTPLVRLLDWTRATEALLHYGHAEPLRDLVLHADGLGTSHDLAERLKNLTEALKVTRPADVLQTAVAIEQDVRQAQTSSAPAVQPLLLLLDTVSQEYAPMAMPHPKDIELAREVVAKQAEMILWYLQKGIYVQAVTLLREWAVSVVVAECGGELYESPERNDRRYAEAALGKFATLPDRRTPVPRAYLQVGTTPRLQELWLLVRKIRNDIAHAGMTYKAKPAHELIEIIRSTETLVRSICSQFGYGALH